MVDTEKIKAALDAACIMCGVGKSQKPAICRNGCLVAPKVAAARSSLAGLERALEAGDKLARLSANVDWHPGAPTSDKVNLDTAVATYRTARSS